MPFRMLIVLIVFVMKLELDIQPSGIIVEQEVPLGEQEVPLGEQKVPLGEQKVPLGEQEVPLGEVKPLEEM